MSGSKSSLFGPAILVTAAFIGPGTVLVASQAGARYGFSLLWAVAFSVVAAISLQEMSARLGIVSGNGLAQAIKQTFATAWLRFSVLGLILVGILVGNAAFQTGNLIGAAGGASVIFSTQSPPAKATEAGQNGREQTGLFESSPDDQRSSQEDQRQIVWTLSIAGIAWLLILLGKFEWLQTALTSLVVLMSVVFLIAAGMSQPQFSSIAAGLVPRIPPGSEWFVVALVGTTVVPYNLFLHASAAAQTWPADSVRKTADRERAVKASRRSTHISVAVGGLVTSAILITAAVAFHVELPHNHLNPKKFARVADVAVQLQPTLGSWSKGLFGAGLLAAGLTSAITAPIAAAYAAAGCFGWPNQISDWRLKLVASLVMLTGVVFGVYFGDSPKETILLAQAANGLLLPVVAVFLLIVMNQPKLMFRFCNSWLQNAVAVIVIVVVGLIAVKQMGTVYRGIQKQLEPKTLTGRLQLRCGSLPPCRLDQEIRAVRSIIDETVKVR